MQKSDESVQLFSNPILEKLSKTNAYVVIDTLVFISLTIFIYGTFKVKMNIFIQITFCLSGFLFFTLLEYLIHRFVYHSGKYMDGKAWQYKVHGHHHEHPQDKRRLALPLPLALILAAAFFFIFFGILKYYALFFFPGFLSGYAFYLFVHYTIHTRRAPKNIFRILWHHHHLHHYKYTNKAFGVTTPFWDIVFRTMPSKK